MNPKDNIFGVGVVGKKIRIQIFEYEFLAEYVWPSITRGLPI